MPTLQEQIEKLREELVGEIEELRNQLKEIDNLKNQLKELKTKTIGDKLIFEPIDTKVFNIDAKQYKVDGTKGADGTFLSGDTVKKTITVKKGIITNIT